MNAISNDGLAELLAVPSAYSDDAVTAQFSKVHKDDLRFNPARGWLRWDEKRWAHLDDVVVLDLARRTCRSVAAGARLDDNVSAAAREALARKISSGPVVATVAKLARGATEHYCPEGWDAEPLLFNTPGGTVDLSTGTLGPHRREERLTKLAGATPRGEAPAWRKFLERVQPDPEIRAYLQRLAGYSLVGEANEECLSYFYGGGGNGKGTFLNTLAAALGEYATTASAETFMLSTGDRHPTDLAKLAGARLVVSQEVDEGKHWDEARIKSLTGRDTISARFMHRDFFEYRPIFTLVIAGNHRPGLKTVDDAIRRRLHLVPFDVTIAAEERNANLKDDLLSELDGVLAWAVAGCLEWQRIGLAPPASIIAATNEYLQEEDTFGLWLAECCLVGHGFEERSGLLYDSFRPWKEARGEGVLSKKKFGATLRDRGFLPTRTEFARLVTGVRLNDLERARLQVQRSSYDRAAGSDS